MMRLIGPDSKTPLLAETKAKLRNGLMAFKPCHVTCTDPTEVDHSVEIITGTRYEVVAQAVHFGRDKDSPTDAQCISSW